MAREFIDREVLGAGAKVFREGEDASCAYIVQAGEVEIIKEIDGETKVLAVITQGGIFGEMALIDEAPRMAGARMSKGGTLIMGNRQTFEAKLAKTDPFIRTLLNIFVSTIRRIQG